MHLVKLGAGHFSGLLYKHEFQITWTLRRLITASNSTHSYNHINSMLGLIQVPKNEAPGKCVVRDKVVSSINTGKVVGGKVVSSTGVAGFADADCTNGGHEDGWLHNASLGSVLYGVW